MLSNVPDGLRHLRNFARARNNEELLSEVSVFSMRPTDYYSAIALLKGAY
jgi:hypothetical protein